MQDVERIYAERAAAMRRRFGRSMNGAVVGDMENHGIRYASSWGVGLPEIRRVAAEYAPDHGFARFLYGQTLRELLLSAYIVADPQQVTAEELEFWGAGVVNTEMAENLAFSLLSRTDMAGEMTDRWLYGNAPELLRYSALLALTRMSAIGRCNIGSGDLARIADRFASDSSLLVRRAALSLAERLMPSDIDTEE